MFEPVGDTELMTGRGCSDLGVVFRQQQQQVFAYLHTPVRATAAYILVVRERITGQVIGAEQLSFARRRREIVIMQLFRLHAYFLLHRRELRSCNGSMYSCKEEYAEDDMYEVFFHRCKDTD